MTRIGSLSHIAVMAAAMSMTTSASRFKEGDIVTAQIDGTKVEVIAVNGVTVKKENEMFDRPHREPIHPTTRISRHRARMAERERAAAPKISAAQAKRDRKKQKRVIDARIEETLRDV